MIWNILFEKRLKEIYAHGFYNVSFNLIFYKEKLSQYYVYGIYLSKYVHILFIHYKMVS